MSRPLESGARLLILCLRAALETGPGEADKAAYRVTSSKNQMKVNYTCKKRSIKISIHVYEVIILISMVICFI